MLEVQSKAPGFSLPNEKREQISLESFRGQHVILAFFPAAFTGVCTTEMCTFRDSFARLSDANAAILGVCVDAPFTNAAFAEKNELPFPILSDYRREVVRAYGVDHDDFAGLEGYTAAKRSIFVVDAEGTIVYTWCAPNPGVEPDYDAVIRAVS